MLSLVNPRRASARVTVLVLSVCLSVCVSVCVCVFPILAQRDTGMKYKKGVFFKTLHSEVMASFTHFEYVAPASFQGS